MHNVVMVLYISCLFATIGRILREALAVFLNKSLSGDIMGLGRGRVSSTIVHELVKDAAVNIIALDENDDESEEVQDLSGRL